jgi:hypothetical protein
MSGDIPEHWGMPRLSDSGARGGCALQVRDDDTTAATTLRTMPRLARTHLTSLVIASGLLVALLVVIGSTAIPRTADRHSDLQQLGFGYPIAFIKADLTAYTPPSYPQQYWWNPWENPWDFRLVAFLVSWAIISGFAAAVFLGGRAALSRARSLWGHS